eukprot:TRINITY_DN2065_c0_g1_i7.p2 TRINITY_DN2065_c0_g1~~TRINITY_DN2065_c0_g1_i7.p2  ORF type:complete len:134 (-),score=17.47 TRINITY_DN2065_c0_g1_i7:343-744(-)
MRSPQRKNLGMGMMECLLAVTVTGPEWRSPEATRRFDDSAMTFIGRKRRRFTQTTTPLACPGSSKPSILDVFECMSRRRGRCSRRSSRRKGSTRWRHDASDAEGALPNEDEDEELLKRAEKAVRDWAQGTQSS